MNWFFIFFFISGFCSVLYELVWLRLSMAQFGVTTAMVSIVLSVFMAGLGLGSWLSGRWLRDASRRFSALRLYALTELLIGVSGLLVPYVLLWGRRALETSLLSSSLTYYFVAGLWITFTLLPWCALMGATLPVAMRAIGQTLPQEMRRSFSYLYMANVGGAVAGTTIPLFLIELLGFRGTLRVGSACNALIAISAFALARYLPQREPTSADGTRSERSSDLLSADVSLSNLESSNAALLGLLFLSGLTSMAMEVIWVRSYTPYFGTVVYAFASILGVYLLATFLGSYVYRRWSERWTQENPAVWSLVAACALLPLLAASPAIHLARMPRLLIGVAPFTGLLGFITPMLVDRFSNGNPAKAGAAYATNIVGCILGPLLAGFGLLPLISERWALVVLTMPWLGVGLAPLRRGMHLQFLSRVAISACLGISVGFIIVGKGYEEAFPERRVLRDPTATVIATGKGMDKRLLVNGYGMTVLTPITKLMAHVPLAELDRTPQNALAICFGMGTTFRSLRSWGIPVTVAELVPSVPRMFSYYHSDAEKILESPLSHVVIDDGRRYLERTTEQYDIITIDPPPPLPAAGSSLLYSEEFYRVVRSRLRRGGILQQWLPTLPKDEPVDVSAVARSLQDSFPYIRAFTDAFGIHFLCSDQPIPKRSAAELLQRMPPSAITDLAEWASPHDDESTADSIQLATFLSDEVPIDQLIASAPGTPALTDDRPINEYYALRKRSRPHKVNASRKAH